MTTSQSHPATAIAVINPATEEVIATIARTTTKRVDDMVVAATSAQQEWAATKPTLRATILWETSTRVEGSTEELAALISAEVGKPLRDARDDVLTAVGYFGYYAGAADKLEGETIPIGNDYLDVNILEPLGITAHIVPWNYPAALTARSLAPALAAGNAAIIKPSEIAPLAIGRLVELISPAFPLGLIQVALGSGASRTTSG